MPRSDTNGPFCIRELVAATRVEPESRGPAALGGPPRWGLVLGRPSDRMGASRWLSKEGSLRRGRPCVPFMPTTLDARFVMVSGLIITEDTRRTQVAVSIFEQRLAVGGVGAPRSLLAPCLLRSSLLGLLRAAAVRPRCRRSPSSTAPMATSRSSRSAPRPDDSPPQIQHPRAPVVAILTSAFHLGCSSGYACVLGCSGRRVFPTDLSALRCDASGLEEAHHGRNLQVTRPWPNTCSLRDPLASSKAVDELLRSSQEPTVVIESRRL